jgi:hypothetical protein
MTAGVAIEISLAHAARGLWISLVPLTFQGSHHQGPGAMDQQGS